MVTPVEARGERSAGLDRVEEVAPRRVREARDHRLLEGRAAPARDLLELPPDPRDVPVVPHLQRAEDGDAADAQSERDLAEPDLSDAPDFTDTDTANDAHHATSA